MNKMLEMVAKWHSIAYHSYSSARRVRELSLQVHAPMTPEEREFYLNFRCALRGNDLVIYDIGASVGVLCGALAKLKNVKELHAFEPIPDSFAKLTRRMQPYPHVTCHNVAVGDEAGELAMNVVNTEHRRDSSSLLTLNKDKFESEYGGDFNNHTENVRVVTLDNYVQEMNLPAPDVVVGDVQGYEDRVLKGGADTINKAKFLILELSLEPLYEGSPVFDDIYGVVRQMGFRLVGMGDGFRNKSGYLLQVDAIFEKEPR